MDRLRTRTPFSPRTPVRPREPGERPSPDVTSRLRPWYVIATTVVVVVLATAGLVVIRAVDSADDGGGPSRDPGDEAAALSVASLDPALPLPLGLAEVGFTGGSSVDAAATEGPAAVGVCGQRPLVEGLQAWRATRLTDANQRRRVGQLVARFRSTTQASTFLAANDGLLGCERWATAVGDRRVTFTATAGPAPVGLGDEARRVDLDSVGDSEYHLRILLIRSGDQVLQLSYVSGTRTDLDALDTLAPLALGQLDPSGTGSTG